MGVITLVDIDYGHIFGPFPVASTSMDPTYAIGMLTQDQENQGPMVEVDPSINNEMARGMEWLSYINPARNEDEQNMEAYMKNKEVFYRALRIIKTGEELLVWYSKDFCQLIDIPDVKRIHPTETDRYICSSCGETFEYIFPLKAHMKFKCEIGSKKLGSSMTKLNIIKEERSDIIQNRKRVREDTRDTRDFPNKMFVRDTDHGVERSKFDIRDVNSNVPHIESEKTVIKSSAFRKVEKEISYMNEEEKGFHSHQSETKFEKDRFSVPPYISIPMSSKDCFVPQNLLSPLMMPSSISIGTDIRTKVMDAYGIGLSYPFTVRDSMMGSMESLSPDSRKQYLMNSVLSSSVPFTKSANPMVEKILQTSNPSMLHKPLPVLTQSTNWCAKCNTSFRMTSDLVYHMRSHHSKETPPSVKKRDDKLKCMICQETFKERHHLTRHMTSHQ